MYSFLNDTDKKLTNILLCTLAFAIIVCIRPLNGLILFIIPALIPTHFFKEKIKWQIKTSHAFIIILICAVLINQFHILYIQTNSFIPYTYTNETFYFQHPKFLEVLFSYNAGLFVYVPKGITLDKPLQVINVLLSESDLFVTQRNLVVLEENAHANLVFCDHTLTSKNFFTNSLTEIFVGEGSNLEFNNLQNEHDEAGRVSSIFVHQGRSSSINSTTITLHSGLVRNNVKIKLDGEGAENTTSGLFLTDKTQHVDNFVFVEHAKPHCTSNQMFKGVLDDQSTGAFNGRILVDRDAQKTAAYQKNSNLLLTSEAKMNTRPQLEIYADDVKCSHGATVGQLDQEALFYMQARGIGKKEARLLLMYAFAHEIIQNIKIENLRFRIDEMVNKRLRGELSRCHNCAVHRN